MCLLSCSLKTMMELSSSVQLMLTSAIYIAIIKKESIPSQLTFQSSLMCTKEIHTLLYTGYWRLFDADYRDRVCQYILTLLEEEDWNYKHVPLEQTISKLEELEPR